ncbi:MAG TPA: hypothetical protein VJK71_02375 [Gemmatimonadales bacterium]|nr:hypothetical protein [Gemmatimonadales bacterium]
MKPRLVPTLLLLLAGTGCSGPGARAPGREVSAPDSAATVPVIVEPTVVAFWLLAADTIAPDVRREIQEEFLRSARRMAGYLADADIALVQAGSDTVVVQLAGGFQRTIMLSGLDFPYGFVLIDPGYAEEFHTGLESIPHLEEAIADYFGLEEDPAKRPHRNRIAQHLPTCRLTVPPTARQVRAPPVPAEHRSARRPLSPACRSPARA